MPLQEYKQRTIAIARGEYRVTRMNRKYVSNEL